MTGIMNNESRADVTSRGCDTILMAYNDTPAADWHVIGMYRHTAIGHPAAEISE